MLLLQDVAALWSCYKLLVPGPSQHMITSRARLRLRSPFGSRVALGVVRVIYLIIYLLC